MIAEILFELSFSILAHIELVAQEVGLLHRSEKT